MTNSTITRRQALRLALVGSAALASTAVVLSAPFASTILARPASSSLLLLGVQAGPVPTTNDVPEVATTELDTAGNPSTGSLAIPILVQYLDVTTGQVQTVPTPQVLPDGTPILQSNEELTGFTTLLTGTIVLTIDPISGAKNETTPTRIILLGTPPVALFVSGLNKNEQLKDVVGTSDGRLLGLVMKRNGTPPVALVDVDLLTGATNVLNKVPLPHVRRFRTLAQSPDGTLYMTGLEHGGETILVRLDVGQKKLTDVVSLNINGSPWNNGLESLVWTAESPSRLLALGAPRYVTPNALYSVDSASGLMIKLQDFDTAKVSLSRV